MFERLKGFRRVVYLGFIGQAFALVFMLMHTSWDYCVTSEVISSECILHYRYNLLLQPALMINHVYRTMK